MTPELSQNLEILARRFPAVCEELQACASFDPHDAASQTLEGIKTACYGDASIKRSKLIHRWINHAELKDKQLLVTTGLGSGEHIEALLDALPQSSSVAVLEADSRQLLTVLSNRNLADLMANPRFVLMTPFSYHEVIASLNLELVAIESCSRLIYAPVCNQANALYQNLLGAVMTTLTTRWNQIRTDVDHAEKVFSNSIENFAELGWGLEINALQNLFRGKPFILVAAGPSLDLSFDFLKEAQGHAVIGVVNSAYRAVVNQGILPELTVAVDPNQGTMRGYQGVDTRHPILACSWLVYPDVARAFKGRAFPIAEHNFFMSIMRKVVQLPGQAGLIGDGTVSSTLVNLAVFFGCNPLFLVGQDLAVSETGQSHATDTFYTDDNQNHVKLESCVQVKGNHGSPVPVEKKLHAYLKIFENLLSHHVGLKCFNLSPTGAFIHGATPINFASAIELIRSFPKESNHDLLLRKMDSASIPQRLNDHTHILLHQYYGFLNDLLPHLIKYAVGIEIYQSQSSDADTLLTDSLDTLKRDLDLARNLITKHPLFTSMLMEGRTKKEFHDFIQAGELWKPITDPDANAAEHLPYIWALIEGVVFQMEVFQRNQLAPESSITP